MSAPVKRDAPNTSPTPLKDIRANSGDALQIVVKVVYKSDIATAPPSSGATWRRLTVDVQDEEGTQMQFTAWGPDCDVIKPLLQQGETYTITNFTVKPTTNTKFNRTNHLYCATFSQRSTIVPYVAPSDQKLQWQAPVPVYSLVTIAQMMETASKLKSEKVSVPVTFVAMVVEQEESRIIKTGNTVASIHFVDAVSGDKMITLAVWGEDKCRDLGMNPYAPGDCVLVDRASLSCRNTCSVSANDSTTIRKLTDVVQEQRTHESTRATAKTFVEAAIQLEQWSVNASRAVVHYEAISVWKKNNNGPAATKGGVGAAAAGVPPTQTHTSTLRSIKNLLTDIEVLADAERQKLGSEDGGGDAYGSEESDGAGGQNGYKKMPKLDSAFLSSLNHSLSGEFIVRASIESITTDDKHQVTRKTCPKQVPMRCNATVREDNGGWRCPKCNTMYPTHQRAFLLNVVLVDEDGVLEQVTIFEDEVRRYFTRDMSAKELYSKFSRDDSLAEVAVNELLASYLLRQVRDKEFVFRLAITTNRDQSGRVQVTLRGMEEVNHAKSFQELSAKRSGAR